MAADSEILRDNASNSSSWIRSEECSGIGSSSGFSERPAEGDKSSARCVSPAFTFAFPKTLLNEKLKKEPDWKGNISGADIARIALSVSDGRSRSPQVQRDLPIDLDRGNAGSLSKAKKRRFLLIVAVCAAAAIVAFAIAVALLLLL